LPALSYYVERIPDNVPPHVRKQMMADAKRQVEIDTFGHGFQRDRQGRPLEQGIGSLAHPSQQSIDAYIKEQTERRPGGPEAGYEEHLAKMRQNLSVYLAKRAAELPPQE
jgi:hypothetical protein